MYELLHNLLKDHENGVFEFKAFSLCHIVYLTLIIASIVLAIFLFKNKSKEKKAKLVDTIVCIAFGLYILDFFLMPFAIGEVNVDKFPFHLCTSMSIMCLLARHTKFFAKFKTSFTIMGMIGGLMYLVYPAGVPVADGYSYRIVQTVIYHGLMIAQGVFAIAFEDIDLSWSTLKYDAIAIVALAVWAFIGNTLYSGVLTEPCNCVDGCIHTINVYDHDFNWFFVKHDALYIIPDDIDIYFVPYVMVVVIFGMCALVRFIGKKLLACANKKQAKLK